MYLKKMNGNTVEMLFDSPVMQTNCVQITKAEYDELAQEFDILANGTYTYRGMVRKQNEFRNFRAQQFTAFDIYKSNVDYGIVEEDEKTRNEIIYWYQTMLEFPETITEENYESIIFPTTPAAIGMYLGESGSSDLAKKVSDLRKSK